MLTVTTDPVRLPPGTRLPKPVQGLWFLRDYHHMYGALSRRLGPVFRVNMPRLGHAIVIRDAALVKEVLNTSTDLVERATTGTASLGDGFGPGSTFALAGDELLERRKLILPQFHGKRMRSYEPIIEEEVLREIEGWPEGQEFETLPSMTTMTLGAILRAVFGAEGDTLDELYDLIPPMAEIVGVYLTLPSFLRRDLGSWSLGGRYMRYRRRFDAAIDALIAAARVDPALDERADVLALLVRARYENGEPISDQRISDEMLTLLVSGHETTAGSLGWTVERLIRHPELLTRLTEEVDAGGSELRQATISEVQRTRTVLDSTVRCTKARLRLGEWVVPKDTRLVLSLALVHDSDDVFDDAMSFNPDRFLGSAAKPRGWMPFGGGVNRCVGASLATMEMDITLRILLREFRFTPTDAPDERAHWRGIAYQPAQGARATVHRRSAKAAQDADSALMTDHSNT
ncbi:cytochrome P450 [Candidatus Mycobacterium wuenschmannii]|uniref:Cytochrome P450 n=1 Tax=Candidatus Mycobacterium wuenschmannii TaxID=3027808 RepID=A0ABY8W1U7_9MYCO|nr:cytochrome P450 [Candidatus Mycobacterium wuenschmannii]WIM88977.1 cytochrome P450 [Candidatus Mycobacterium wuenschmannii]